MTAPPPPAARWLGTPRIDLESCASTNDEAARLARAGAGHGTIVIAHRQDAGRGREGRTWASPPGGLYLSAVLRPSLPLALVPPMTLAIGIGLCDAVRSCGAPATLKWPNDVLVGGKKLAGVLVEAQSRGGKLESVVVGIGVNLQATPEAVAATAVSLAEAAGTLVDRRLRTPSGSAARPGEAGASDRQTLVASLLAHVERWIDRYVAIGLEAVVPAWHDRMAHGLAARATVDGAALTGEVAGLDPDGALLLRDEAGRLHRVQSGDVEVIPARRRAITERMSPRVIVGVAVLVIACAVVLFIYATGSPDTPAPARPSSPGRAVVVPMGPSSPSPSGGGVAPALPGDPGAATRDTPKDYMVGNIRVRDHRSGDNKPLDVPPNPHPADRRELPSSLTHDISQQVKRALYTCATDLPKDARGTKPRLEGQLTVAIKDHTLAITNAVAQIRDVDGPSQDAIKQCVEHKAVGMTSVATDQADLADYGIQITFTIP